MKKLDRPDWDDYFMTLAFIVAQRSLDQRTKHGSVFVSEDKTVLSMGYNSPPRGYKDEEFPQDKNKYTRLSHSEINGIANAARVGISLLGSTLYVTGLTCASCLSAVINCGCKKIIYGPIQSACIDFEQKLAIADLSRCNILMVPYKNSKVLEVLQKTVDYYNRKIDDARTAPLS